MNIFWLDKNIAKMVSYYTDQHLIKIILEITQMLYTALWMNYGENLEYIEANAPMIKSGTRRGYRPTHKGHPMTKWVAQSGANYRIACKVGLALCARKKKVYEDTDDHACKPHLLWLKAQLRICTRLNETIESDYFYTNPPICVGDTQAYRDRRIVESPKIREALSIEKFTPPHIIFYRYYYVVNKLHHNSMVQHYKHNQQPDWVTKALSKLDVLDTLQTKLYEAEIKKKKHYFKKKKKIDTRKKN